MSKILYPIFKLPSENEDDVEYQAIPTWIKWWLLNNYNKKHSWVLSEIITGNPLTLENSVATKFYLPPFPGGNSEQVQTTQSANLFDEEYYKNATYSTDVYKYTVAKFQGNRELYIKAQLKTGGSVISGAYVGISTTPNPNNSGGNYRMAISNGNVSAYNVKDFTGFTTLYFCYFPTNLSLNDVFDNYNFWVSTDNINYVPFVPDSPSPDYPQEITNVTGDVEVVVSNADNTESQTYTFPLGTQRMFLGDYLADDGIHHVRKQVALKDLTWLYNSDGNRFICNNIVALNIKGAVSDSEASSQILSNVFKVYSNNVVGDAVSGIRINYGIAITTLGLIRAKYTDTTDVSTFIEMLTNKNAILEYELAEEEITPYTTEQQTAYDEIKQALSYDEQTNISGSSDEANPLFEVQYYMKNESEGE